MLRRTGTALLLLLIPVCASSVATPLPRLRESAFAQRERAVSRTLIRASQFVDVPHLSLLPGCEDIQQPEALTTPDPLFPPAARGQKVKVSFIIGADGRVHSPLILQSAGMAGDRRV